MDAATAAARPPELRDRERDRFGVLLPEPGVDTLPGAAASPFGEPPSAAACSVDADVSMAARAEEEPKTERAQERVAPATVEAAAATGAE
jgi:hypothetical protein